MSMYDKNHYNTVISLQLIKINEKIKREGNMEFFTFTKGADLYIHAATDPRAWVK